MGEKRKPGGVDQTKEIKRHCFMSDDNEDNNNDNLYAYDEQFDDIQTIFDKCVNNSTSSPLIYNNENTKKWFERFIEHFTEDIKKKLEYIYKQRVDKEIEQQEIEKHEKHKEHESIINEIHQISTEEEKEEERKKEEKMKEENTMKENYRLKEKEKKEEEEQLKQKQEDDIIESVMEKIRLLYPYETDFTTEEFKKTYVKSNPSEFDMRYYLFYVVKQLRQDREKENQKKKVHVDSLRKEFEKYEEQIEIIEHASSKITNQHRAISGNCILDAAKRLTQDVFREIVLSFQMLHKHGLAFKKKDDNGEEIYSYTYVYVVYHTHGTRRELYAIRENALNKYLQCDDIKNNLQTIINLADTFYDCDKIIYDTSSHINATILAYQTKNELYQTHIKSKIHVQSLIFNQTHDVTCTDIYTFNGSMFFPASITAGHFWVGSGGLLNAILINDEKFKLHPLISNNLLLSSSSSSSSSSTNPTKSISLTQPYGVNITYTRDLMSTFALPIAIENEQMSSMELYES